MNDRKPKLKVPAGGPVGVVLQQQPDPLHTAKVEQNWDDWVYKTRHHVWEQIVADRLLAMAVRVGLFDKWTTFDIMDISLANIRAKAIAIIHDAIDVTDLPTDFWERWDLLVEQSGSSVLMTVVEK